MTPWGTANDETARQVQLALSKAVYAHRTGWIVRDLVKDFQTGTIKVTVVTDVGPFSIHVIAPWGTSSTRAVAEVIVARIERSKGYIVAKAKEELAK